MNAGEPEQESRPSGEVGNEEASAPAPAPSIPGGTHLIFEVTETVSTSSSHR